MGCVCMTLFGSVCGLVLMCEWCPACAWKPLHVWNAVLCCIVCVRYATVWPRSRMACAQLLLPFPLFPLSSPPPQLYKVLRDVTYTGADIATAQRVCAAAGRSHLPVDPLSSTGRAAFISRIDHTQFPLDVETYEGWTPLCRAALIGDPILARQLLVKGCKPDKGTRLKHTPLTYVLAVRVCVCVRESTCGYVGVMIVRVCQFVPIFV